MDNQKYIFSCRLDDVLIKCMISLRNLRFLCSRRRSKSLKVGTNNQLNLKYKKVLYSMLYNALYHNYNIYGLFGG